MYRGRLWTMRQFAGFGTAEETNERFHYLLDHGQRRPVDRVRHAVADGPRLRPPALARARSGREGVAVDTLDDMETLFEGIDLGEVTTSMTINAPAAMMLAFYVVAAEKKGIPPEALGGTIQTDILKEYIAQKEWCFPVDPAMRMVTDMVEYCSEHMPRWHPISISGYHIREAGSTAQQELAFTLKDGFTYVEEAIERGIDVDAFAPRLSFFFNAHIDFFEEIAKYRAARRIWAREMRETYGAKDERSLLMRCHAQTAGVSLTAQQPFNNVVRTALEAMSACSAAPSRCTPTPTTRRWRCRPRRRCASRCARSRSSPTRRGWPTPSIRSAAPTSSRHLTDRMEEAAYEYFRRIDELGGMVEAVKQDFPQREIADASFQYQTEVDKGERIIVGVNEFHDSDEEGIPILRIDPALERKQIGRVEAVRARRDTEAVESALAELREAAGGEGNLMYPLLDCARAHCTEGEIVESLQQVFGSYTETPVF